MSKIKKSSDSSFCFHGMIPALMLPVSKKGKPNWKLYVSVARSLMDHGASAVVANGSMGDWSLIDMNTREKAVEQLVKADIPVVVGTGAQNPATSRAIARHAKKVGAVGLMMIPRLLTRTSSESAQRNHFASLLDVGLPSVIYNSPYYSYQTKEGLFFSLLGKDNEDHGKNHLNLKGFKEFGGATALSYAAEKITSGYDNLSLVVGVDTQVYHGYMNCGAVGAITGVGNAMPKQVLTLMKLCEKARSEGDFQALRLAKELDEALHVLSSFDEGVDLVQYYRELMCLADMGDYSYSIEPTDELSESQKCYLLHQYEQFMRWWKNWHRASGVDAILN